MPSNIKLSRKANKLVPRRSPSIGGGNVDAVHTGNTQHGDIKLRRVRDHVELNANYHGQWYKTNLSKKAKREYSYRVQRHMIADNSVTADTYEFISIGGSKFNTSILPTLQFGDNLTIPTRSILESIAFVSNIAIAATDTAGVKVFKYKRGGKGVVAGSLTSIGSYTAIKEATIDEAVVVGRNYSFPLDLHFEYGDIMLLQMKAKDTDSVTGMAIRLVFKEFWNEIK